MVDNVELFRQTLCAIEDGGYKADGGFVEFNLSKKAHESARYYPAS